MLCHFGPCHDIHLGWTLGCWPLLLQAFKLQSILKICSYFGLYPDVLHWLFILFNSVYSSKPFPLCTNVSFGRHPRSFCTLISFLPAGASLRSSTHGVMIIPLICSCYGPIHSFAQVGTWAWVLSSAVLAPRITIPLTSPAAETPSDFPVCRSKH